jgi:ABC-2 type transport system permease protein
MRSQQGFQLVMQLLIFPLIFLSGVFFPVNNVPQWLEVISKINPVSYGVDAIRQLFLGGETAAAGGILGDAAPFGITIFGHTMGILEEALLVLAIGLVFLGLAIWSFGRQE